jgi:hypothetical protein
VRVLVRTARLCLRLLVAVLLYWIVFLVGAWALAVIVDPERLDGRWESTVFILGLAAVIVLVLFGVPRRRHRHPS